MLLFRKILLSVMIIAMVGACQAEEGESIVVQIENSENKEAEEDFFKSKDTKERLMDSETNIPNWSKDAVIYEVNVRQYTAQGTFKAFESHLPRLKEMGVDILWFMPIHPISEEKREGTLGSYYAVQDFKAVNPEFGTLDEFKELVDKAHSMGFKVLLDWVANHTGWDNVWIDNDGWYTTNSEGEIISPSGQGTTWVDVAELNYENTDMRSAMVDAMKFWVEEVDVDGYRADYAGGVPVDFWETAKAELDKVKEVYMLAEDNRFPELLYKAFNSNYGWDLRHTKNDIANGKKDATAIQNYIKRIEKIYPKGSYPMHWTANHDENSWDGPTSKLLGESEEVMAMLTFTLPGIPLIYSGQEAGLDQQLAFFDKDEIIWEDLSTQTFYEALIQLKKNNQALWNGIDGGDIQFLETDSNDILAFERHKDGNRVIVLANLSSEIVSSTIGLGDSSGKYKVYFSEVEIDLKKEQLLDFNPWEYKILLTE